MVERNFFCSLYDVEFFVFFVVFCSYLTCITCYNKWFLMRHNLTFLFFVFD